MEKKTIFFRWKRLYQREFDYLYKFIYQHRGALPTDHQMWLAMNKKYSRQTYKTIMNRYLEINK